MSNEELAVLIRAGVDVPENMVALYEQNKGMMPPWPGSSGPMRSWRI